MDFHAQTQEQRLWRGRESRLNVAHCTSGLAMLPSIHKTVPPTGQASRLLDRTRRALYCYTVPVHHFALYRTVVVLWIQSLSSLRVRALCYILIRDVHRLVSRLGWFDGIRRDGVLRGRRRDVRRGRRGVRVDDLGRDLGRQLLEERPVVVFDRVLAGSQSACEAKWNVERMCEGDAP